MSTAQVHVPMAKTLCVRGCGHMAAGGDHGHTRIKLADPAVTEEDKIWVLWVYHDPRAKISKEGKAVLIPNCPPPRGIRGEHRRKSKARKRRARREAMYAVRRGEAVAGIHKVSASSPRAANSNSKAKAKEK